MNHKMPVEIYGENWYEAPETHPYDIDNNILNKYYSSADIVLNDTQVGMRKYGFISNRIYDVSACGSFIISDYSKVLEDTYGDSVAMWKNEKEFTELVNYYLKHPKEREIKAKKAREITLKNYTLSIIMPKIIQVIKNI